MDLQNFKFDFSGFNLDNTETKEEDKKVETVSEKPKDFDFESLAKNLDHNEKVEDEKTEKEPAVAEEKNVEEPTEKTEEHKEEPVETKDENTDKKETEDKEESVDNKTEEKTEEAKPKTKRHRRTKKEIEADKKKAEEVNAEKDVKATVANLESEEEPAKVIYVDEHENHVKDYNECVNEMFHTHVDKDWNSLKEAMENELNKIKITNDINPATLSAMAANIDTAFDMVAPYFYSYQSLLDQLTDKDTGKVTYVRNVNSVGTNAEDRKRNGLIACTSYKENGTNCNLIELVNITKERYGFLNCCIERLRSKQNILFTLTANLKMAAK